MPRRKPHPLKTWQQTHGAEAFAQLAKKAHTSVPYLRHVIAGRRRLSPDLSHALIAATSTLGFSKLKLGELCAVCRKCPYYRAAKV